MLGPMVIGRGMEEAVGYVLKPTPALRWFAGFCTESSPEPRGGNRLSSMPCLLPRWRSCPDPAQGANSTPNDSAPQFSYGHNSFNHA